MMSTKENTSGSAVDFGKAPFEWLPGEAFATLKFVGEMDFDLTKEFEKRMRPLLDALACDLVIDLLECGLFDPGWTRPLMQVVTSVKKAQRQLRVVTTTPDHKTFFQKQGISGSLPLVADLATATRELTAKKSAKLDVNFINPFLEGTVEVLRKTAGTTAKAGAPGTRSATAPLDGELSGVIAVNNNSFAATVILSFPSATYLKIISRMLGEAHEAINSENQDGVAELMNQIFGFAKRILNENGHQIQMARPTVVAGKNPADIPPSAGPRIAIPFESDAGTFSVEIRLQKT